MLDMKGNKITFFGHSTFSLTTQAAEVALLDSWVTTNPKCPEEFKENAEAGCDIFNACA